MTVSPSCLPMRFRRSDLTGSLWVPSPRGMYELRNGWPSMVPRTLTRPRVPKNAAESGITTYVQPPLAGDFCSGAWERLSKGPETLAILISPDYPVLSEPARRGWSRRRFDCRRKIRRGPQMQLRQRSPVAAYGDALRRQEDPRRPTLRRPCW